MKLDPRIKNGYKPLDCFDTEYSEVLKPFLQKEGYFSNNLRNFLNLNSCKKGCLVNVFAKDFDCFVASVADDFNSSYKFFIPEAWVKPKEPEKKYRPFSYKEFWRLFDFGDGVCFRRKGQNIAEFSMFLGYEIDDEIDSDRTRAEIPGEGKVNLGGNRYTLAELFEYYELELDDEWQPFGVEDKE